MIDDEPTAGEGVPMAPAAVVAQLNALITTIRDHEGPLTSTEDAVATLVQALADLREVREQLAAWEPELITAARAAGASWITLAPALGVTSRQAAERRYLRMRPTGGDEATKEGRVQTTRDQRAGDRAVTAWAHANSAELRQLAGQVSGLPDLSADGRRDADRVHAELGGDDSATLLEPLSAMRSHLTEHIELTERLDAVSDDVDRERRDAVSRRQSATSADRRHASDVVQTMPDQTLTSGELD